MQSGNKSSCSDVAVSESKTTCANHAQESMQATKKQVTTSPATTCLIASLDASAREFYTLCAEAEGMELEEWLDYQPF